MGKRSVQFRLHWLVTLLAYVVGAKSFAASDPSPRLKSIASAGSGCVAGQVGKGDITGNVLRFDFPAMDARAGGLSPLREARKNCGLVVDLDYAKGWQYRVKVIRTSVHSRGNDVNGVIRADVRHQGETTVIFQDVELKREEPAHSASFAMGGGMWSSCSAHRPLVVQMQAKILKTPEGAQEVAVGMSGPFELELEWRTCRE